MKKLIAALFLATASMAFAASCSSLSSDMQDRFDSIVSGVKAAASDADIQAAVKSLIKSEAVPKVKDALENYLADKVLDGTLTESQADKIMEIFDQAAVQVLAEKQGG